MNNTIELLLKRRSVLARDLISPGPSAEELDQILACGHRVPDHGKIGPWRFVVFEGDARADFGALLGQVFLKQNPDTTEKCVEFEQGRLLRAPLVIAVVSTPIEHKVPEWEQVLTAGAVCQNVLNAATALGYGAQWLTEWYSYDAEIAEQMGVTGEEKIAGFIYIGRVATPPSERKRPELSERVIHWRRER